MRSPYADIDPQSGRPSCASRVNLFEAHNLICRCKPGSIQASRASFLPFALQNNRTLAMQQDYILTLPSRGHSSTSFSHCSPGNSVFLTCPQADGLVVLPFPPLIALGDDVKVSCGILFRALNRIFAMSALAHVESRNQPFSLHLGRPPAEAETAHRPVLSSCFFAVARSERPFPRQIADSRSAQPRRHQDRWKCIRIRRVHARTRHGQNRQSEPRQSAAPANRPDPVGSDSAGCACLRRACPCRPRTGICNQRANRLL